MRKFCDSGVIVFFAALILAAMFSISSTNAQTTPLPYYCSFETKADTTGWIFVKRSQSPSEWSWGEATSYSGSKSIYISADDAASAGYIEHSNGYHVAAYKKFTLASAGDYDLSFDIKVGGEATNGKVNDGLKVVWMPATSSKPTAGFGSTFPNYAILNGITFRNYGNELFDLDWTNVHATVNVPNANSEYYLAFVWKTNGGAVVKNPGACIDNVQLALQRKGECAERPTDITVEHAPNGLDYVITWKGNADKYDVRYYKTNKTSKEHEHTEKDIASTSLTIPLAQTPEGIYTVEVRSICNTDTSIWSTMENVFIYDASTHCLDYLNFNDKYVQCTYGKFDDPYANKEVKNFGPESKQSVHTIHYKQNEYDPRTLNQLKTVPDGSIASVRISNWTENNAESGSITYTYTVTEDADVLKLQYATVLQYEESHEAEKQTGIMVEVLDANTEQLISECTYSNFNAKNVDQDKIRGWHRVEYDQLPEGLLEMNKPILWSDWMVIGMNLSDYIGQTFKIRITLKACGFDVHFAYAYFTLDCDKSEVEGISCGEHPNTLKVPEGFLYEWYKTHDPDKTTVCDKNIFVVQPEDTCSYTVNLIYPENDRCYFTLQASTLPRKPIADILYECKGAECRNTVQFHNTSKVFGFWKGDTIETNDICKVCEWNFGKYGTSHDPEPTIEVPAEGDTFNITLRTAIDKGWGCTDEKEFTVCVPSIILPEQNIYYNICDGNSIIHDNVTYDTPGRYPVRYTSSNGCDSVVILNIDILQTEITDTTVIICGDEFFDFHGKQLNTSGHYADTIRSSIGCDSVIRRLELTVNQTLEASLTYDTIIACADCRKATLPYIRENGLLSHISISFDSLAHRAGFTDIDSMAATDDAEITIIVPETVRPNRYRAVATLYNSECGNLSLPFVLDVRYPSSVITQRWNDVLALLSKEYNGGYEFVSYQWHKDGNPIPGEIRSIFYSPEELDFEADYSLLITRLDDGVSQYTCAIRPIKISEADDVITVTFAQGETTVITESQGIAVLHDISGRTILRHPLANGYNQFTLPDLPHGIYILSVETTSGLTRQIKIAITQH